MSSAGASRRPPDRLVRTVSREGGIAVRAMVGTALVDEAVRRHGTAPAASVALGRALMGAVLMAASAKHGESVQLQLRGDGPLGTVFAIADAEGRGRGYASQPRAHVATRGGAIDVAGAVGRGVLVVVRERAGSAEPYSGIVPLVSGTVAQDLAHYLAESEQIHAAIALGVYLEPEGVASAGGFFAQALPGASEAEIEQVESNVRGFPGPGELVREGLDADAIVDRLLAGLGSRERQRSEPVFHCGCQRERVLRAVTLLGAAELSEVAAGDEPLDVSCRFCGERYRVSPDEIGSLLADA